MSQLASDNPSANAFGPGVTKSKLTGAIERSGYPLQTITAMVVRSAFERAEKASYLQQEWSYVDRDTGKLRSLDINASCQLYSPDETETRVWPHLTLLIECKKSELPYVFFLASSDPAIPEFPLIAGLGSTWVRLHAVRKGGIDVPLHYALGLHREHDFLNRPARSATFSSCAWRKGGDLELCGSEAYESLVLPVVKALHHFRVSQTPRPTFRYFDAHLALGVGVVDATMVGVRLSGDSANLILIPWVRVVRHEYSEAGTPMDRHSFFAVDIVHKDFVEQYVSVHVLPFADQFGERILKHDTVVADGEGMLGDLRDIESGLRPKTRKTSYKVLSRVKRWLRTR